MDLIKYFFVIRTGYSSRSDILVGQLMFVFCRMCTTYYFASLRIFLDAEPRDNKITEIHVCIEHEKSGASVGILCPPINQTLTVPFT